MKKFTVGQKLATRSICSHDTIYQAEVLKVTEKTVVIKEKHRGEKRCKIHHDRDGYEYIYPHGRYSMCPIFRA